MQNSMMFFTFFVCGRKCPFWANLDQGVKIVSVRSNLMPAIIHGVFGTGSGGLGYLFRGFLLVLVGFVLAVGLGTRPLSYEILRLS